MDLSTVLLLCAIAAGLSGGIAARFRRWGTAPSDLAVGLLVAGLFSVVSVVVLVLAAGLDLFGIIHYLYLLIVVGFPVAVAWIIIPQLIHAERRTPFLGWLLSVAAIGCAAVGLWSTHVEPFRLQVETETLGATGATRPIVVGVIADLQTRSIGPHEDAALDDVLAGEPDLVVIPGDLFQLQLSEIDEKLPQFLGWLRRLTDSVDHVVIVNGNVDIPDLVSELADESGAIFLNDEITTLNIKGQQVVIAGASVVTGRSPRTMSPVLAEGLEAFSEDDLVLAVSHYPDLILDLPADSPIDLMLAGHTHGGQVSFPRIGPPITFSEVPKTVAAGGLHLVNGTPLYVSTGVGLERGQAPQLRFGAPPSVGLLTIVPAN